MERSIICETCGREDKKCNGWKSWETWLTTLYLDNGGFGYPIYDTDHKFYDIHEIAKYLKELVEENIPNYESGGYFTALILGELEDVDWYEIVESHLESEMVSLSVKQ